MEEFIIEKMFKKKEKKKKDIKPSRKTDIQDLVKSGSKRQEDRQLLDPAPVKEFNKIQKVVKKNLKNKTIEKAMETKLSSKDRKEVIDTFDNPEKLEKIIQSPPKKPSMAQGFTGAILEHLPFFIGTALGGVDMGTDAQAGAQGVKDKAAAQAEAQRKAGLEEREISVKEQKLVEDKFQFDADLQFKKDNAQFKADTQKQLANLKSQGVPKEDLDRYIPGVGMALTKDDAKKGKEILGNTNDLVTQLDNLVNLREEHGAEFWNRSAVSSGKAAATNLKLLIKDAAKLGVMSEQDKELLDTMIPDDPLKIDALTDTTAQLKEVKSLYINKLNSFFIARGLNPPRFKGNPYTDKKARAIKKEELKLQIAKEQQR